MACSAGRLAANGWLPWFGIWLLACSVDHRHLRLGSADKAPGAGADDGAAGTTPATNSPSPDGGAAGASPEPGSTGGSSTSPPLPPLVNGCADLDTDMVADCTVTLVKNPSFKSDVTDWTAVDTAKLAWDPRNALGDTPSGCALLTAQGTTDIDGSAPFRASQCVPAAPNQIIIAWANALIDSASGAAEPAQAELEVSFFDAEGCAGQATGEFSTPPSSASGWATIQAGRLSGPATSSASVALVGLKPNRAEALSVCFDNVMVKAKAASP
jgi:hypothetical protein